MTQSNEHQYSNGITDARTLGWPKTILLGLQHTFAMFGATVLVPLLTGLNISTTLLMAGLGTLLFHIITKGKVPAFLGSSFAFLGGYAAVAPLQNGHPNTEMLPYACGGVLVAGFVYVVLATLIKFFTIEKVMRVFPPVVTGPIIISIGLILAPSAIKNAQTDWLLAIIALASIIFFNMWGRGMAKIVPIILGVVIAYAVALLMGRIDFTGMSRQSLVALPPIMMAKFDLSAIITITPIALATMMEHIGDISAIGATTGNNYIKDPGLHRTLLGDGLATMMASLFGGPANTTYGENTGVLALTKVYDPLVIRIAACFAIVLSFIPKFAFIIETIPAAIIGGVSLILYGMISAVGIRNLVENQVNFKNTRNTIITALILVCSLGFNQIGGLSFKVAGVNITLSGLAIAAIVGIAANSLLPGKDYLFSEEGEDEKFQTFKI
ncbi:MULTISPECIES: uracil-xanthine permease family protein [Mogibacterium]|uniref:Permease family protein n=2 Tax=Mogibacterium timidum TaxID=35519 RepID=X8IRH1_9FIRM|nr:MULTISPECIES: uracil-xanthine permease family protein [Mogibacterium]EJU19227.1 permease family protein [Mogibacterium sp. CM50]EUC52247.1 permease family protein [Mogibacterium timidum ATCC 33093]NWO23797.1 uracil-xanthine permease [Mogibacterium timidum]